MLFPWRLIELNPSLQLLIFQPVAASLRMHPKNSFTHMPVDGYAVPCHMRNGI